VRSSPHALVRFFLQHAEQFALQVQRHFADFDKKNGPAFGGFETAGALFDRPGESAARVTEKSAFKQILWNRSAIDTDERLVFAPAALVNFARDEFLAGAAVPENQCRGFGIRVG
jgi:hypothetical protein